MSHIRFILSEIVRYLVPLAILGVGVAVLFAVIAHGRSGLLEHVPEAAKAALVETSAVERQAEGLDIDVDGLVVPYREITLAAEVAGRVVKKTPACQAGSYVKRGELLLEIDPRDYQFEVRRLEKQLEQSEANLREVQVEEENTRELISLAEDSLRLQRKELARLKELDKGNKGYVTDSQLDEELRNELTARNTLVGYQNQLRTLGTKRAGLKSARDLTKVLLEKARLDLTRTKITSPIDGIVVQDSVESDAYLQRGTPLATIEDTSKVEVRCNLRMDELFWILDQKHGNLTALGDTASAKSRESIDNINSYQLPRTAVTVEYSVAGQTFAWEGVLERYEGIGLDQDTRTVPCTVVVEDPSKFCRVVDGKKVDCQSRQGPSALVRGMFVKLLIHILPETPLLRIPELAMRPGGRVWRVRDDKLSVVPIQVVNSMGGWAVIQAKIEGQLISSDRVVISPLAAVEEGMAVREKEQQ